MIVALGQQTSEPVHRRRADRISDRALGEPVVDVAVVEVVDSGVRHRLAPRPRRNTEQTLS
jgi:hypothetical protein